MADYNVLPITDSFSVQRCLMWAEPTRSVLQPCERPQSNIRTRPVSGIVHSI